MSLQARPHTLHAYGPTNQHALLRHMRRNTRLEGMCDHTPQLKAAGNHVASTHRRAEIRFRA